VLITGGAGFIGSHLADAYLERGDEVFVIDDLSTGTIENIQHLKTIRVFITQSIQSTTIPFAAELVDQCDVIFHLAAAVGVKLIVESPVRRSRQCSRHGSRAGIGQQEKEEGLDSLDLGSLWLEH